MHSLNSRSGLIGLIFASLGLVSLTAWAYIPPASFILHEVAKKHLEYSTIRVRSNVIGLDGNGNPNGVRLREITYANSKDGAYRSWVTDESGKVLYTVERSPNAGSRGPKMPVASEVLFDTNSVRIANTLKSVGIEIPGGRDANSTAENVDGDKMSLHRWNHSVAWVLGKSAQLWIEKDTFVPVRVIAPARGDTKLYDFQMENFKYYDDYAYPRAATLYESGKKAAILKAELVDVILDPDTEGGVLPKERGEGFTDAGNSASSQVHDLIETYYRLVR